MKFEKNLFDYRLNNDLSNGQNQPPENADSNTENFNTTIKTEFVPVKGLNSKIIDSFHASSVRLQGNTDPRIVVLPQDTSSKSNDKESDKKARLRATYDQVFNSNKSCNSAKSPYNWENDIATPKPYGLINGIVSTAKTVDSAVAVISRTIVRTPDGDDTGQWLLATPYRFKENIENKNLAPLAKQVATTAVVSAVALSYLPKKEIQVESDSTLFTSTENGVVAHFDTAGQDIDQSARVAELAIRANEGSVVIDDKSQTIRFTDPNLNDTKVIAGIIAASAPDNNINSEPEAKPKESTSKSVEEMTDKEYMQYLAEGATVSVDEYKSFEVNTDYEDVFKDELNGNKITPTKFVAHWTAVNYKDGVEGFIRGIKGRDGNCCSSMYFISKAEPETEPKTYRFSDSWEQMAHAYGANNFTQGAEIEAEGLRNLSPEQMKQLIMTAKRFMDANDISITRDNFVGHMEIDAEYGRGQKPDMPPELMDGLFTKLKELDAKLPKESDNTKNVQPENINPSDSNNELVLQLLDIIAAHEGNWDSVNRGKAGDTVYGSDAYNSIFGERSLSELTLQEVLDLQKADKLFAVGRYQFIPATLSSAVEYTGIDTSKLFNQDTQNRLVIDYILLGSDKRHYLRDYLLGKTDDLESAIEDLCKEWASMPCNDGSGYYDGDSAGNNAVGGEARLNSIKELISSIRDTSINSDHKKDSKTTEVSEKPKQIQKVVLLGDSLTVGMNDTGSIKNIDEQFGLEVIEVDARVGRGLVGGKDNGLESIDRLSDAITQADIVYLGYGTNPLESTKEFERGLQTAIEQLNKINPSLKIVLPLIYSDIESKDDRNKIIGSLSSQQNIKIIDVSNKVELSADGIHPRQYQDLAKSVAKEMSEFSVDTEPKQKSNKDTKGKTDIDKFNTKEYSMWLDKGTACEAYRAFFVEGDSLNQAKLDEWINSLPKRDNHVLVSTDALPVQQG